MKQYQAYLTTLVAVALLTFSCKKDNGSSSDGSTDASSDVTIKNVTYGSSSASTQNMDVYLPAGRTSSSTKIMIAIHGGYWTSGDKSDFDTAVITLRPNLTDYAIFNINYRLAALPGTNLWPAQINDVDAAVKYIIKQAANYHIDTSRIVLLGASAGAHLALLEAYRFNQSGNIKAVVDLFGPTDIASLATFNDTYYQLLTVWLGGTAATASANYTAASPLSQVTPQSPPTIIFHGTADDVVPISQSNDLYKALTADGVVTAYYTYAGEGHGWTGSNLLDTYTKALAFVKSNVK